MQTKIWFFLIFLSFGVNAQVTETFSDGDFSANPSWIGTTADYIVNSSFELQTNLAVAATSYLSVYHGLTTLNDKEWRLRVKMSFSPSTQNFGRIYLCAASQDPTTNPDGFYIQLGETGATDAVKLFSQVGGASTLICSGAAGAIANSFDFGIQVIRNNSGLWSLSTDAAGGTNYVFQSNGTDATNLLGTYFIWQCTYTVSNANKFYLDDIYVGSVILDLAAPALISAVAVDATHVDVFFNEPLEIIAAQNVGNYDVQPFNSASNAVLDVSDPKSVHLTTATPLSNGNQYTLFAYNIEDLAGNDTTLQSTTFTFFIPETPLPGDVIINEVFADPSPVIGLPELEFVEIYNRSNKYFDLAGWKIGDISADGTIATSILAPNEYRVLCSVSSVPSFTNSAGVSSFPSLNNAGDDLVLKDPNGIVLDKISYTEDWYQDLIKQAGGYTLERINPTLVCSSSHNWIASNAALGGTPGTQNSVYDASMDTQAPSVSLALALAPNVLTLQFSEPMDAVILQAASLTVQPALTETNRILNGTQPTEMSVLFTPNIAPSTTYTYELSNVEDCAGNVTTIKGFFILADDPVKGDIVINEILFDPITGANDYVELYNTSDKVFDLFHLNFASISNDTVANVKQIPEHFILFPGEYAVVTKDTNSVKTIYPTHGVGRFMKSELPTYANDAGTVILKTDFLILDSVSYTDDWHFKLLDAKDGKALERINALDGSNDANNWHTAAEAIGFGTPGLENSQFVPYSESGDLSLPNKVFSPDNDGFEDVLQLRYSMAENGMLANISIYDDHGRLVRKLSENEFLATEGVIVWDGVKDDETKASIGQYIVLFEAFQATSGTKFAARRSCVLAGKL